MLNVLVQMNATRNCFVSMFEILSIETFLTPHFSWKKEQKHLRGCLCTSWEKEVFQELYRIRNERAFGVGFVRAGDQ